MKTYIKSIILICTVIFLQMSNINAQNTSTIPVSGSCGMCKNRIETTAIKVPGVTKATYDIDSQMLTVQTKPPFDKQNLVKAIQAVGHDADGQKAADAVYEDLPGCCHYRGDGDEEENHEGHDHGDGHDNHDGHDHGDGVSHENSTTSTPVNVMANSNKLTGTVFERSEKGELLPIIGASVVWLNDKTGTVTDHDGKFEMTMKTKRNFLVVSYIGYSPDTLLIEKPGNISITISTPNILNEVTITHKRKSTEISYLEPIKVYQISSKELLKAACCNLAESFDTTPAIDAASTDAVTGIRKIEMLGLAGPYIQLTTENMPSVRGLAALQGLAYIPGPWVESMQLNMGAGSVVNGFESLTGQINVELRKPTNSDQLYFNAYGNQSGRYEMNTFNRNTVNDHWSTATLLHASLRNLRRDENKDGFLDSPLGKQVGFINRWDWSDGEGKESQIGVKLTYMDNISGQNDFDPVRSLRDKVWGADMTTQRAEVWAKRGFVDVNAPYKSLGMQFSGTYHDQKAQFGLRRYDATQKSLYFNMIYQTIIDNTDHQVRMGPSFQYDNYDELVGNTLYKRNEWVPGIFGEYTYKGSEQFTVLVGARADYHNNFGLFFTPRLNVRYAPSEKTVFRIAAGRGQRTASIFAENIGLFASSRNFVIEGGDTNKTPYGLNAEVAWNVGLSATKEIEFAGRNLILSADFNRIQFQNQVVVDLDRSARTVAFYNLRGKSFSNSLQVQADLDVTKWMDLRVAYRYNDVKTTYGEQLLEKPLSSPHRAFANLAIKAGRGWVLDYTVNRMSKVRIPYTGDNEVAFQLPEYSKPYFLSNVQITKSWKNKFDLYAGGENIFNYKQSNPILSAGAPFGSNFDSSLVWGPIMGVNIYAGLRYTL
jgi:outer membrane receptor for ferrienterochelin and colicins